MQAIARLATALGLVGLAVAQFPPKPEGQKVIKSKNYDGVTISYKEVAT